MAFTNAVDATQTGMQFISTTGAWSAPTITQNSVVIGDANNEIKSTAALTNGQVVIGSTGVNPVPATLTAGSGITITNGAGTITIASTSVSGLTWSTTSVNLAPMVKDNGYIAISPGGALTFALPATAGSTIGDTIALTLDGATSWQVTQAASQQIRIGSSQTTAGTGGSLTSTAQGDTVTLVYQATGRWNVISLNGNITVV